MNTDKFIRLNTVFKPPKDVIEKAMLLSREIGQANESFFILDGIKFHPHITIYSPEYPESNTDKVFKIVEEISNNTGKAKLDFKQISSGDGYISIGLENSPEIRNIHKEVVTKLNPLRGGHLMERYQKDLEHYNEDFSPERLKSVKKYGYPDAMDLYKPHLTIIRLKDKRLAEKIAKKLNREINQFIVDKIAVYTMGENGTCRELIKEFTLK